MTSKLIFLVLISFSLFAAASSGGVDGGGGKSIVCYADDGRSILSTEVLDLYEGRIMFGKNIPISNEPMLKQINLALQKIPQTNRAIVELYANIVLKNMKIAPAGTKLLPINDSHEVIAPGPHCSVEQAANYYSDKLILISGDIWSNLSETGKAALIIHEAVYAANRVVGATSSRQSRHVVASLFDPLTEWTDVKDQLPIDALICISPSGGLMMWAYQLADKTWNLQFQILGNSYLMSKKTYWSTNQKFDFSEAKSFPIIKGDDLVGLTSSTTGFLKSKFEDDDLITITKKWESIKDNQGQVIPGYQTPRYYLRWRSGTFPNTLTPDAQLNCSVVIP